MNIEKINSTIKACFNAGQEKFVDVIFIGSKYGKTLVIVKDDKYATLIDVEEKEVISHMEIVQERYFESVFDSIESVVDTLSRFKERSNLEIRETKLFDGKSEFLVKMEIKTELNDDFIIRKLINKFVDNTIIAKW